METRLKKLRISGWGESTTRSQTISYKTVLSDIRHAHAESFILIILIIQVVCVNFQQKPNIHPTRFSRHHNTSNPARMVLWDL